MLGQQDDLLPAEPEDRIATAPMPGYAKSPARSEQSSKEMSERL